jgi:nitrogen fixation protein NifU and related proteins
MFTAALLDHFQRPRNAGELPNATAQVEVSNPVCGDVLQLAVLLQSNSVAEARFLCRGCAASIACASLLTEKIKGRELPALSAVTAQSIADELGGLPEASAHAAQLAQDALRALLSALTHTP